MTVLHISSCDQWITTRKTCSMSTFSTTHSNLDVLLPQKRH